MNYRRWLIVGYMLLLMAFAVSVLLIPGQKYDMLTTSDSGWVYDIAVDMDRTNALVENNPLSHAPDGQGVGSNEQVQPLVAVMLYKAVNAVNPSVTLMDVVKYFAPLIFALSLIPIFLIGRELAGDLGGCAAAFFAAVLANPFSPMSAPIYWHKVGAFDREPIQLILAAWGIYLTIKMFKAPKNAIPKFALLTGLVYGLFGLAWSGWHYLIAMMMLGLLLVLLVGFLGKLARKISDVFGALFSAVRGHLDLIAGTVGMVVVITIVLWGLGGMAPQTWVSIFQSYTGYLGLGGGGGGRGPTVAPAGEARPPESWHEVLSSFYGVDILTIFIIILIGIALFKFLWSRKRWELLAFSWLAVIAALVIPGVGQVRFERLWWLFVPVMAGVGAATLVHLARRFSLEPSGDWLRHVQTPIVLVLVICITAAPFVYNAYAGAARTAPPTGETMTNEYMEAFGWIRENTPEDSVLSIQWSYGHLLTGATRRPTVTDGADPDGEEGVWENDPAFPIRPPDYIWYVKDGSAFRYGVDVQRKSFLTNLDNWVDDLGEKPGSFEINGRRIDVQYFPIVGENEFRWLVTTYRDNYGVKIDYIIFSYEELMLADSYYRTTLPWSVCLNADGIKTPSGLRPTLEDQIYVFNFGENREAVVLDHPNQRAYLRVDGGNPSLDGYGFLRVDREGKISDFLSFYPPSSPGDIPETLLVFLSEDGGIVSAWLVKGISAKYLERPVPMALRVWFGDISDIDYLQVAFSSSNNLVKVAKINHVPSLISPANGARINDNTPELTWYGAVGASRHRLEVDDDASFSSPLIQLDNLDNRSYTTDILAEGSYWWRVGAYDSVGNFLGWSESFTFTIDVQVPSQPQLTSPQDGAELTSLEATFQWTEPEPGVIYDIQIDDENGFTSPYTHENTGLTSNSYAYTFSRNGVYYWRVMAKDNAGNESGWPSSFALTVRAPPQEPTPSSPENGTITNDNMPTFQWAVGNGDNYRLLLDNDPNFADGENTYDNANLGSADTSLTIENELADGAYYWEVVAIVGSDENSSAVWTFTVDATPPEAPSLVAPENENQTSDNTPTFEWTVGSGADNHRLVVDQGSDFSSPVLDVTLGPTDNTYTTPDENSLPDDNYYWKVIATDAAGNSNSSPEWLFTVISPGV